MRSFSRRLLDALLVATIATCSGPDLQTVGASVSFLSDVGYLPGWQFGNGTLGTDFDESTSVYLSGDRSIQFLATTPANDPYMEWVDAVPVEEGTYYTGEVIWRASSIAAGNTMKAEIRWLDAALADVSQSTIHDAILAAANAWEYRQGTFVAPSGARFMRLRLSKNNTAFSGYIDGADIILAQPVLTVYMASSPTYSSGSASVVKFDTTQERVGIDYSTSTGKATIVVPGIYCVSSSLTLTDMANGSYAAVNLKKNSTDIGLGYQHNWSGESTGTDSYIFVTALAVVRLVAGDTISAELTHTHGSSKAVANSAEFSKLSLFRVE